MRAFTRSDLFGSERELRQLADTLAKWAEWAKVLYYETYEIKEGIR